nr:RsmB/NOP family class I SAM-dependent RNA methyltransferase [Roseibacterium persicicum]
MSGVPAEQALTNWGRGARYAGSKDRAAVRDHVYDVLRAKGSCAVLGGGGTGRALMLGLVRLQGADPAAVFTGEGHAPAPLTAGEAQAEGPAPDPRLDVPGWTLPMLEARVGDGLPALLEGFRHRAPLFLRVNRRRATVAQAAARLAEDGVEAVPDPRAATALEVTSGARRVKAAAAFADGWVEPQDLSVQRAVAAVDWPAGRILDYCAGGGGKALALADLTEARVFAHDAEPRRMADLAPRAARAGVTVTDLPGAGLAGAAPFDAVLCDVPCSGSGTWRRDPEAKWRLMPERLSALQETQAAILRKAARLVAPGGRLVYMTCSLFRPENEDQVARFLAAHPGWTPEGQGAETPLTASDGFFHAVLRAP